MQVVNDASRFYFRRVTEPTTYRNSFHDAGNPYKSAGPETFTTKAEPHEYRGFLIYERIPTAGKHKYGEIDAVIGGLCIMISCTVIGAKYRIDNLLRNNGEDRALAKMAKAGIEVPEQMKTTLF